MADRLGLGDEAALLKTYFDRDARLFQYVGVIGAGATGAASRVNYYNENSNTFHSYIVHVIVCYCCHLCLLNRRNTTLGVQDENGNIGFVTQSINSCAIDP